GVEVFLRGDVDGRRHLPRDGGDVVAMVDEFERAVGDLHGPEVEVVDLVARLRTGLPVREVMIEGAAGLEDFEGHARLDQVDAADADLASPERIDAAGDDDLLDRGEVTALASG